MTVKTVPNGVLVDKQTGFGTRLLTGWMSAVVRALNATTAAQGLHALKSGSHVALLIWPASWRASSAILWYSRAVTRFSAACSWAPRAAHRSALCSISTARASQLRA